MKFPGPFGKGTQVSINTYFLESIYFIFQACASIKENKKDIFILFILFVLLILLILFILFSKLPSELKNN